MADLEVQYSIEFSSHLPGGLVVTAQKVGGDGACDFFAQWHNVNRVWSHSTNQMKRKRTGADVIPEGVQVLECFCLTYNKSNLSLPPAGGSCPQRHTIPWPEAFILDASQLVSAFRWNYEYLDGIQQWSGICHQYHVEPNAEQVARQTPSVKVPFLPSDTTVSQLVYAHSSENEAQVSATPPVGSCGVWPPVGTTGTAEVIGQIIIICSGAKRFYFQAQYGVLIEIPDAVRAGADAATYWTEVDLTDWDGLSPITLTIDPLSFSDTVDCYFDLSDEIQITLYPAA